MSPERAVLDRYDINGYFTKAEATEDKLYSLVKSVRQYLWTTPLGGAGDSYTQDGNGLMVHVPGGPLPGGISFVAQTTFAPPESVMVLYHRALKSVAALAMRARA